MKRVKNTDGVIVVPGDGLAKHTKIEINEDMAATFVRVGVGDARVKLYRADDAYVTGPHLDVTLSADRAAYSRNVTLPLDPDEFDKYILGLAVRIMNKRMGNKESDNG